MKLLTRQEYNLILRSLDYYDLRMTKRDKEIRDNLEDNYIIICIILKTELLKLR